MNLQDQVIYFHRNGKPGMRFLTGPLRRLRKEKEITVFKIQGNHGDHRWMHKCSICGFHFFEDEDSGIKETGICKKCRKEV